MHGLCGELMRCDALVVCVCVRDGMFLVRVCMLCVVCVCVACGVCVCVSVMRGV